MWTIAVVLFALWALGLLTGLVASGFVHILLILAIVVLLIWVVRGNLT